MGTATVNLQNMSNADLKKQIENLQRDKDVLEKQLKEKEHEKVVPVVEEFRYDSDTTFKDLLLTLLVEVTKDKMNGQQAAKCMFDWYHRLPQDKKESFKEDHRKAEEIVNYYKNIVETFAQQLPYMFTE